MNLVLDVSAAVELILHRKESELIGKHIAQAQWVLAPSLFTAEMCNVFWKYHQFSSLPIETCEQAIEKGRSLPDTFTDDHELWREAFDMACRCKSPAYDMLYLVLARRQSAQLLTMNKKLKKLAIQHDVRTL